MHPLPRIRLLAAALLLLTGLAHLGPLAADAQAAPAIVLKYPGICFMPGADENGNIIFGGVGLNTTVVENGNKIHFTCKGRGLVNLSGKAQHFKGFVCNLLVPSGGFVLSNDSQATVSPNGVGTLECTFTIPKP